MGVAHATDEREVEAVARAMHRRDYNQGRARYDWDEMQEGYREDCCRHARAALDAVRGDTVKLDDVLAFLRELHPDLERVYRHSAFGSTAKEPNALQRSQAQKDMEAVAAALETEFRRSPDAR